MKRSAPAILLAAAFSCSAPVPLLAQPDAAQPAPSRAVTPAPSTPRAPRPVGPTISVTFSGGTISQYIDSVRDAADPFPVNVTYAGGAENSPMPALELKSVSLSIAIKLIEEYTRDNHLFRLHVADLWSSTDTSAEQAPAPVFVIRLVPMNDRRPFASEQVCVLSLAELTTLPAGVQPAPGTTLSADVVLSAIEAALKMAPVDPPSTQPEIKYHPDSGLVIIRGDPSHTDLAIRTIATLESPVHKARAAATAAATHPAVVEIERANRAMESMNEQITTFRDRCAKLEDQLHQLRSEAQKRESELTLIVNDLQRQLQAKSKNPG